MSGSVSAPLSRPSLPQRSRSGLASRPIAVRVGLALLVVVTGLVVLSVVNQFLLDRAPIDDVVTRGDVFRTQYRLFHLDREMSVPAWFSSMLLAYGGSLMVLRGWWVKREGLRDGWRWIILGVAMFCLSADESAAIHEGAWQVVNPLFGSRLGDFTYAEPWVLPAVLAAGVFLSFYVRFTFRLSRATRLGFIAAGVVYLAGVVGIESLAAVIMGVGEDEGGASNTLLFVLWTVEETLEMLGLTILATTMTAEVTRQLPAPQADRSSDARA